jgi:hypothetical protein
MKAENLSKSREEEFRISGFRDFGILRFIGKFKHDKITKFLNPQNQKFIKLTHN